ncbi:hypothetical protein BEWA_019910 [Theileria equi strain WA]|uniref:Uncharacterized protein n=1 Tax=Theileria equi strain WA TaxID=1537102 RepID=L0AUB2_THEEQ|nr:hypothetical protein BEWA_019910 [Theileria equi strain WA]AFZ79145.1 hypothetical protein BEWA_019910 [Theileria equi strain WA]|eukprot:XP_004828811.1 hypothetical protein BEWA_019910 [Theileria equi strain WA]
MKKFLVSLWRFTSVELRGFSHTIKIDDNDQCVSDVGTSYSNTNSARSYVGDVDKDAVIKSPHTNPSIEFDFSVDRLVSELIPERKYTVKDDHINGAIPQNLLIHMGKLPCYFEKLIFYSVLTCLDSLLFEITFLPIQVCTFSFEYFVSQAINTLSHLTITAAGFAYKELCSFFNDCFFLTSERLNNADGKSTSGNGNVYDKSADEKISKTNRRNCNKPSNDRIDHLSGINLSLYHISNEKKKDKLPLTTSEFCGFVRFFVLVASILIFSNLDTSKLYHNIRGQPFIKLYVIFNMLEICERLCRSFGLDAMDSLMRTTIRIFNILNSPSSESSLFMKGVSKCESDILSTLDYDISDKYKIINVAELDNKSKLSGSYKYTTKENGNLLSNGDSDMNTAGYMQGLKDKLRLEVPKGDGLGLSVSNTCTFNTFKNWDSGSNIYYKFVFLYSLVVLTVSFHSFLHLVRVLSINIAINSSESAMLLLLITNNFAEIKSTVFKKYNYVSLFIIFASDAVERSYLFCDGLNVFLKMLASKRY